VWRLMVLFLLLLPAGFAGAESPPSDLEAPALAQLLERNAPAVVTVRARLRSLVRFGGDQQENEQAVEARGVMVSPRGLVLLSNSYLSATRLVELPVRVTTSGRVPAGYVVTRITTEPEQVRVRIPVEDLGAVAALKTAPLSLAGRTTSLVATQPLELPERIRLVEPTAPAVVVKVAIDPR